MNVTLDLDDDDVTAVGTLHATGNFGKTFAETAYRLFKQRIWQITGEVLATAEENNRPKKHGTSVINAVAPKQEEPTPA